MPEQSNRISVVIPLYNGSDHIQKCIEQLDNQDCRFPFEVLIVDDASTDKSAEIVELQLKELKHTEYFHLIRSPRNGRAGSARNIGIKTASGEYILFIDQDDYPDTTMLRLLWENSKGGSVDLVSCAVMDRFGKPYFRPEISGDYTISETERKQLLQCYGYVFASLIRRSILIENSIFFAENVMFEDCLFNCGVLSCVKTIQTIKNVLYFRINEEGSQTGSFSVKKINDRIDATLFYLESYRKNEATQRYMDQIKLVAFYYIYLSNMLWIVTMPDLFQKDLFNRVLTEGRKLDVKWSEAKKGGQKVSRNLIPIMHLIYICPIMAYPVRACGAVAYKAIKLIKRRSYRGKHE